jgi:tetratricopeptide (TPR) repeat protein
LIIALSACSKPQQPQLRVQRPALIDVPRNVQQVVIRRDLVRASSDRLGVKEELLQELASQLNQQGRFQVEVVDTFDEAGLAPGQRIGIVQGEVLSGGEVDQGQFTEIATCKGGVQGRIAAGAAAAATENAVTLDSRAFVCQKGDLQSDAIEMGAARLLTGLGVQAPLGNPVNQVVRTYRYRNLSLYAEANLSFTVVGGGEARRTLAVRADGGSFGRQVIERGSYTNQIEARPLPGIASLIQRSRLPLVPIPVRNLAVVEETNPRQMYYDRPRLPEPSLRDLPEKERSEVVQQLVRNAVQPFLRTVSPTSQRIRAEVAEGGRVGKAAALLRKNRWEEARQQLEGAKRREAADWYNLGLSYEGGAVSREDYEEARRNYQEALKRDASNAAYAAAIGRVERRLAEYRLLKSQQAI